MVSGDSVMFSVPDYGSVALTQSILRSSGKQGARAEMLAGKRPKECAYCWTAEDRGRVSDRIFKSSEPWSMPYFKCK